jgi:hypothetical protein
MPTGRDRWTARIVADEAYREREWRIATIVETAGSLGAAVCVCVAVWGFTAVGSSLDYLDSTRVGGLGLLCAVGLLAVAVSGGIKKRMISLVGELSRKGLP